MKRLRKKLGSKKFDKMEEDGDGAHQQNLKTRAQK